MLSGISASASAGIDLQIITEREKMIVFLLIIGLLHKEIATLLSSVYGEPISFSLVCTMISGQIYSKSETSMTSILVQKAICSRMFYNVPRRLVEKLLKVIFIED